MHSVLVIGVGEAKLNRKRKMKKGLTVQDSKKGVRKQNYVSYCCGLTETDKREKCRREEEKRYVLP